MSSGTDAVDTGAADTGKTAGTVAEAAADALRTAADFLESAAASNWADAESSRDVARSCRRIAEALPVAPRRGARRVLHPTNLEGRYHSGSQQDTAISDVAEDELGADWVAVGAGVGAGAGMCAAWSAGSGRLGASCPEAAKPDSAPGAKVPRVISPAPSAPVICRFTAESELRKRNSVMPQR